MKRVIKMRLVTIMLAGMALVFIGCSTTGKHVRWYEGAPRDHCDIATLKVRRTLRYSSMAFVESIDSKPLNKGNRRTANTTKEIELLPGKHTLEVSYGDANMGRSLSNVVISFNFQPGRVYELRVAPVAPIHPSFGAGLKRILIGERYLWTAWIVDLQTNEVVAGRAREETLHWYE